LELGTTFDDPYLKAELRVVLTCGFWSLTFVHNQHDMRKSEYDSVETAFDYFVTKKET
jgi:hypothetical protein